jgi:glycoside/pentoside/hexuronide:cation symporter, GPH family
VLAYLAYSVVSIAFQSWGASLSPLPEEQVRLTTTRETFGMVGVLLAVMLLSPEHTGKLAIGFCALALLAGLWSYRAPAPRHRAHGEQLMDRRSAQETGLSRVRQNGAFRWLLTTFVFNGVATAIPATLVLFFSADVLKASTEQSALFLGAYFLAAALGMPFWLWFSRQFGLRNAWLIGIAIAVIGFVWTLGLGPGDHTSFMLVCVATGFALGSDLAMPPALLALVIAAHGDRGAHEGAYFGIWNLATKLNLAIAAGLALPLTQWLGQYWSAGPAQALALIYAGLPSALKLIAAFVLVISPLPGGNPPTPLSESTT